MSESPDRPLPQHEWVRKRMMEQRRIDTKPELALRRLLFAQGHRYRVAYQVPGLSRRTIDIAFPRRRLAVFVDGCFWHRCPLHYVPPKNNGAWWADKIGKNVLRDAETTARLEDSGWTVLRFYEHMEPEEMALRVARTLASR